MAPVRAYRKVTSSIQPSSLGYPADGDNRFVRNFISIYQIKDRHISKDSDLQRQFLFCLSFWQWCTVYAFCQFTQSTHSASGVSACGYPIFLYQTYIYNILTDSCVSTVTKYWATDESGFDFRREKKYFSSYRVHTDSDPIQALVAPYSGVKRPRYQANHFHPKPRLRKREIMHTSSVCRGSWSTGESAPFLLCYVNTVHFLSTVQN